MANANCEHDDDVSLAVISVIRRDFDAWVGVGQGHDGNCSNDCD